MGISCLEKVQSATDNPTVNRVIALIYRFPRSQFYKVQDLDRRFRN